MEPQGFGYRADIDGLRAIAVLAVVGFHAFPTLFPGGFIGVDIFFVISGFLISSLIVGQLRSARFSLMGFYARRARRILPALAVVLVASLLFGWFALLPDEYETLSKHVAGAAVFASNFVLWQEGGYFDTASELKPLLHLWSLGIEEQFYLAWPLALLVLWVRDRKRLWLCTCLLVAGSFAMNLALVYDKPTGTFYFPLTRFWELGAGCLLALASTAREPTEATPAGALSKTAQRVLALHARRTLPFIGLALILVALVTFNTAVAFPGWAALLPVAGAACIIAAGPAAWINRRVLAQPALVAVGLVSYSLYLWHWPLLSFANILESGTPPPALRAGAVLLSFALAGLTYRFVEVPCRTRRSAKILPALTGGFASLTGLALLVLIMDGFSYRSQFEHKMLARVPRSDPLCWEVFGGKSEFDYCRSTSTAAPELLVLGDSHAQAIYDGARTYLGDAHSLMLLGNGGCPPLLNADVYFVRADTSLRAQCRRFWTAFVEFADRVKPSVVILVGRGSHYFEGDKFAIAHDEADTGSKREAFRAGLRELVQALEPSARVVYVMEHPFFDSSPACFMRPFTITRSRRCAPVLPRAEVERRMASYRQLIFELAAELPHLTIIDPLPVFCDSQYCYQQLPGGTVLYRDTDHLNVAGGRRLVENSDLLSQLRPTLRTSNGSSHARTSR